MPLVVLQAQVSGRTLGVPIREAEVQRAAAALGAELLRSTAESSDVVVAQELALAYGRPDVVVASIDLAVWRAWRRRKVAPCTAPLPLTTALALAAIGGSASLDELTLEASSAARARVRRSLTTLGELGWVSRRGNHWKLRLEPAAAISSASAVEAKLNNWRRAVRQVRSWESYVDAVFLAFPSPYLPNVPRTQSLRRFGLIAVQDGQARITRKPTGASATAARRILLGQHLYSRWLSATGRPPRAAPLNAD